MNYRKPTPQTYNELQMAFDIFNTELFEGILPECIITLQRGKKTCGYFAPARFANEGGEYVDEIALNPQYFNLLDVTDALQTLLHEMVHQWQHHFGQASRACYHNKEWAQKMQLVGLMPSSTGQPGGKIVGQRMSDYPIEGGVFLENVSMLKARGFCVTWSDRFKPMYVSAEGVLTPISQPLTVRAGEIVVEDSLTGEVQVNRASRSKYTHICMSGKAENLWGRAGLSVACCKCGLEFTEVE